MCFVVVVSFFLFVCLLLLFFLPRLAVFGLCIYSRLARLLVFLTAFLTAGSSSTRFNRRTVSVFSSCFSFFFFFSFFSSSSAVYCALRCTRKSFIRRTTLLGIETVWTVFSSLFSHVELTLFIRACPIFPKEVEIGNTRRTSTSKSTFSSVLYAKVWPSIDLPFMVRVSRPASLSRLLTLRECKQSYVPLLLCLFMSRHSAVIVRSDRTVNFHAVVAVYVTI